MDVIALALCLMLVSFMLKRSPAPAMKIPERRKVAASTPIPLPPRPPPPQPPDAGEWDSARQSQRATEKARLEELLKSAALPQQIVLRPLTSTERLPFVVQDSSTNGSGQTDAMIRHQTAIKKDDLVKEFLGPEWDGVLRGRAPDDGLLHRWHNSKHFSSHRVVTENDFDWEGVHNLNRFHLVMGGGVRIVFTNWARVDPSPPPVPPEPESIY